MISKHNNTVTFYTPIWGSNINLVIEPVTFVRSQARLSVIPEQQVALNNNYFPYLDCFKSLFHVSWGAKEKHLYLFLLLFESCTPRISKYFLFRIAEYIHG